VYPNCTSCGTKFFPKDISYSKDKKSSTTDVGSSMLDRNGEINLHSANVAATNQIIEMEILHFSVLRVETDASAEAKLFKGSSSLI
jgi:hypothetical protein